MFLSNPTIYVELNLLSQLKFLTLNKINEGKIKTPTQLESKDETRTYPDFLK